MKYLLTEITTTKDGGVIPGIFTYDTREAALSAWHTTLASKMADTNVQSCICRVEDSQGSVIRWEHYPEE